MEFDLNINLEKYDQNILTGQSASVQQSGSTQYPLIHSGQPGPPQWLSSLQSGEQVTVPSSNTLVLD